jgi:hypothetical protein
VRPTARSRSGSASRSARSGYLLDLLDLPETIGEQIVASPNRPADGSLTEKHGRALRQLGDSPDLQQHLVEKIKGEKLSGEDTNKIARALRAHPDKQDEILGSAIDDLPRVLGRGGGDEGRSALQHRPGVRQHPGADAPDTGRGEDRGGLGGDLPAVEGALEGVRAAVDALLAEVRAARREG